MHRGAVTCEFQKVAMMDFELASRKGIMMVLHHLLNIINMRVCNREPQTSNHESSTTIVWVIKSATRMVAYRVLLKIAGRQKVGCR